MRPRLKANRTLSSHQQTPQRKTIAMRVFTFCLYTASMLMISTTISYAQDLPKNRFASTLTCQEGEATLAFVLDDKGGAKLTRITGLDKSAFDDFREKEWTANVSVSPVPEIRIANARGVLLSVLVPIKGTETIGKIVWNHNPVGKIDFLCEFDRPL